MSTSRKGKGRHHLCLEQKVKVINKCTAGSSVKALSEEFCCGTTQIYCILKNKKSIMKLYEANASGSLHLTNKTYDIYNLDETGCFWRALPDKGFGEKGKKCKGAKKLKHRVTVAFLVSAAGEKEDPIVIWKSAKPRCFRGVLVSSLPVKYFHQKRHG